MTLSPVVRALVILAAAFVAGVILIALGLTFIGIVVAFGGLLVAFIAWFMAD